MPMVTLYTCTMKTPVSMQDFIDKLLFLKTIPARYIVLKIDLIPPPQKKIKLYSCNKYCYIVFSVKHVLHLSVFFSTFNIHNIPMEL